MDPYRAFFRNTAGVVVSFSVIQPGIFHVPPPTSFGDYVQFEDDEDDEGIARALPVSAISSMYA